LAERRNPEGSAFFVAGELMGNLMKQQSFIAAVSAAMKKDISSVFSASRA
jgi:hypothetical protein